MPDYTTIESVLDELYASLSGPAGPRDLERKLRLYHPRAHLMRSGVDDHGRPWLDVMTPEEHHQDTAAFLAADDFYEVEVARTIERFGNIAWARSVYEARRHPSDPEILKRGINSIQLYHDGTRWWIVSVLWDNEREGVAVPAEWLESTPPRNDL